MSNLSENQSKQPETWVKFEEGQEKENNVAVIDASSIQVNLENSDKKSVSRMSSEPSLSRSSVYPISTVSPLSPSALTPSGKVSQLHNIPLNESVSRPLANVQPVIRQGFSNGDVIVMLLPQNTALPWITPARFRPELVPEELMAQGLTLTVEDYVHILNQLVNDSRFTLYNIFYKRILMVWITLGFVILLAILFSGLQQLHLFGAGIAWLLVNASAIFICMWIKIKLNRSLERCIASINMQLLRHKILLGLDDRGKLSCHKVNLCFIYFDTHECWVKLQELIDSEERNSSSENNRNTLSQLHDIDDQDYIIAGSTNTRISRQQERAILLLCRYSHRWVKSLNRGHLKLSYRGNSCTVDSSTTTIPPRHSSSCKCPCQFIEDHLQYKPQGCFESCGFWQQGIQTNIAPPNNMVLP